MPKNRKIAKKIKIEKKNRKKLKKTRKSWEKRTRSSCDNLLFNSWKKYKGNTLYFKRFFENIKKSIKKQKKTGKTKQNLRFLLKPKAHN